LSKKTQTHDEIILETITVFQNPNEEVVENGRSPRQARKKNAIGNRAN